MNLKKMGKGYFAFSFSYFWMFSLVKPMGLRDHPILFVFWSIFSLMMMFIAMEDDKI
jgi:hypothetical protein